MQKKQPGLSRPGERISVKAEHFLSKPLSKRQQGDLARLKNLKDNDIDYSDIPELSDEQLAGAVQPKR